MIVTFNLADFPADALTTYGVDAQHPDEFIAQLFDLDTETVCAAVKRQRESLKNPPKTVDEFLAILVAAGACSDGCRSSPVLGGNMTPRPQANERPVYGRGDPVRG